MATKKNVYTDFHIYNPARITANTNRKFNIRIRNIKERWIGWSNRNHPVHLREMN